MTKLLAAGLLAAAVGIAPTAASAFGVYVGPRGGVHVGVGGFGGYGYRRGYGYRYGARPFVRRYGYYGRRRVF